MVLNRMAKGNNQWLLFHVLSAPSVAPATRKPLFFFVEGLGDALEGDFSEAWRGSEDRGRTKRKHRGREMKKKRNEKKTPPTLIIIYLGNLRTILTCISSCNMNLDSTCMEMKCLKKKYIKNVFVFSSGANQYLIFNGNFVLSWF